VADEGGGARHGNPLTPDGIYRLDGDGSARVVADIGTWVGANPVAEPPEHPDPDGDLTGMVASNGALLVVESNGGQILRVTPQGEITRVVDLSGGTLAPKGLAIGPDGTMYVGMTPATPEAGGSKVIAVAADGSVQDVWTGLTALMDVAIGPDGTLYALELGNPDASGPLGVASGTGRVLRQSDPAGGQEVAVGIDRPVTMAFGPDQGLYVSTPAVTEGPSGAVIRLNLQQGRLMTMSESVLAASPCATPTPAPTQAATAAASASANPEGTPAGTADATSGTAVSIENFSFGSSPVTVSVGTTVTWTNNDVAPHTVTATDGSFSSGNLNPGESFSFTFSTAGTFDYVCSYHPNMTGSIVVQ
jgi:plastocyanin